MTSRLPMAGLAVLAMLAGGWSAAEGQVIRAGGTLSVFQVSSAPAAGIDQIQLWTTPVRATWSTPRVTLDLHAAFADALVTYGDGSHSRRSSPSDAYVSVTVPVKAFSFTAFGSLPMGESTLGIDEIPAVGVTGSELLPLAVGGWGGGGSVGGSFEVAGHLDRIRLRLSGGFIQSAAYRPVEGPGPLYEPGSQITGRMVVDWPVGASGILTTLVGHRFALDDTYGDTELLRAGGRYEGAVTYSLPVGGREALSIYTRYTMRTDAQLGPLTELLAGRQLPGLVTPRARNLIVTGVEASVSRRRLAFVPSTEIRLLGTGDGTGGGWLAVAGGHVEHRLGGPHARPLTATASLRLMTGGFEDFDETRTGLSGFEVGLGLRWGGR